MKIHSIISLMAVLALAVGSSSAMAASQTWSNIGSDWSVGANWGGSAPGASGTGSTTNDIATFPEITPGSLVTPNLDQDRSIGAIVFDNTDGVYNLTGASDLRVNRATVNSVADTYFRIIGGGTTQINASNIEIARGGGGGQIFNFDLGTGTLNLQGEAYFSHNGSRDMNVNGGTLNLNGGFLANTTGNSGRFLNVGGTGDVLINGYSRTDTGSGSQVRTDFDFTGVLSVAGTFDANMTGGGNDAILHRGGTLEIRSSFDMPAAQDVRWQAYADTVLRAGSGGATVNNLVRITSIDGSQAFQGPTIGGSNDLILDGGFRFEMENSSTATLFITNTGKTTFGGSQFWIGNTSTVSRSMEIDIATGSLAEITAQVIKGDTLDPPGGNPADLIVSGGGTLILSNNNNIYSGTTTVNGAATLIVDGVLTDVGSTVFINSGASLGGSGTINRNVEISGILSPGNSPGTLTFGDDLDLLAGSSMDFEVGSTSDLIVVLGELTVADGFEVNIADIGGFVGSEIVLFSEFTTFNGDLSTWVVNLPTIWQDADLELNGLGNVVLTNIEVIPEPTTAALLGLAGLALLARRRRTA